VSNTAKEYHQCLPRGAAATMTHDWTLFCVQI
jgi:hypothetical protein